MGSFFNFKNFGDTQLLDCSSGKVTTTGDVPLARQSSIYSLTFDELQGTFSGLGKDFGSMNMEDLLKMNIWMAEGSQAFASTAGVENGITPSGNLQRQGSLTLPRTLSQKTVDEVWRDMFKESTTSTFDGDSAGGSSFGQRQNTLGEMTLEDFLQRAGVAKEEPQQIVKLETAGFYGALAQPCSNSSGLSIGFQPAPNQKALGNQFLENINPVPHSSDIILNLGGTDASRKEQHKEVPSQHQSLFSNGASVTFSSGVPQTNNNNYQISSPQTKVAAVAMSKSSMNSTLVQHSPIPEGAAGLAGLSYLPASRVAISPGNHMPSNAIANRKLDILPVSPLDTVGEGGRGRRSNSSLEKVVERRRKRMIKNRESAARSRSRKQAYTLELEAEIANLKELNQNLKKKQAEFIEMQKDQVPSMVQKDQVLETVKIPWGGKRRCLERTLTGPW